MTKIINLFGGPGSGKSTTAAGLFHKMKTMDLSVEYVSEFAKDIVYENSTSLLGNQLHVFSEQFRRQWRLLNKVDYVITDSPILLSSIYIELYSNDPTKMNFTDRYKEKSIDYFDSTFEEFNNINFFLKRPDTFETNGRIQNLEQSINLDNKIINKLTTKNISFRMINSVNAVEEILKQVINT